MRLASINDVDCPVKTLRESRGLSQTGLGGTSQSFVWRVENGRLRASMGCLIRWAPLLGVTAGELAHAYLDWLDDIERAQEID